MSGLSASSSGCSTGPVGPPTVLRMDNGPELISQALQQFCSGKVGPPTYHRITVEQRLH